MSEHVLSLKENGRSISSQPGETIPSPPARRAWLILGGLALAAVLTRLLLWLAPPTLALDEQAGALTWVNLAITLPLAWLGLRLAPRVGIDATRFRESGIPWIAATGSLFALLVITVDLVGLAPAITRNAHASFPAIVPLYLYLGVLMTLFFRVFLATTLTWVGTRLIRRHCAAVYWTVSVILVLALTAGQWVSFEAIAGADDVRTPGVVLLFALGGAFDLWLYGIYRRRGTLACLIGHLAYLATWHMLWGGLLGQALGLRSWLR